jgi:hypothetical protein
MAKVESGARPNLLGPMRSYRAESFFWDLTQGYAKPHLSSLRPLAYHLPFCRLLAIGY